MMYEGIGIDDRPAAPLPPAPSLRKTKYPARCFCSLDDEALDDEALDDEALDDEALDDEALDDEALDDEALDDYGCLPPYTTHT